MQCTRCGRENDFGSSFCISCGSPLTINSTLEMNLNLADTPPGQFILTCYYAKRRNWIIKKLVKDFKMSPPDAEYYYEATKAVVQEYEKTPEFRKKKAKEAKRALIVGPIFFFGGIGATILSYACAPDGGTFYIFWGAVLYGMIHFFVGLSHWSKYSKPLAEAPTPVYVEPAIPSPTPQYIPDTAGPYVYQPVASNLPPVYTPLAIPNPTPQIVAEIPAPKVYQPAAIAPATPALPITARLILPDMSEKVLPSEETSYGRHDFEKSMPTVNLDYVSRQHFKIKAEAGRYFIADNDSSNGTRLNGKEIKGIGYQALKNNDQINIADMLSLTFKSDSRA